jgi:hypothetical protein
MIPEADDSPRRNELPTRPNTSEDSPTSSRNLGCPNGGENTLKVPLASRARYFLAFGDCRSCGGKAETPLAPIAALSRLSLVVPALGVAKDCVYLGMEAEVRVALPQEESHEVSVKQREHSRLNARQLTNDV